MLFTPTLQDKGMRLDKYLASQESLQAKDYSRSRIASLITEGYVAINNDIVYTLSVKITSDSVIKITFPSPLSALPEAQNIPLDILYEDEDVIVINKPAGLTVHPAAGNHDKTLVNALLYHCKNSLSGIGGVLRPGIVHRIDKDTSGVMIVAKNDHGPSSFVCTICKPFYNTYLSCDCALWDTKPKWNNHWQYWTLSL